ncbi:MAG: FAD/NAD(P)-binding protein [Thermodesulfobacteriota bacterium]
MDNIYEPIAVDIIKIQKQSDDVRLFSLKRQDGARFKASADSMHFIPGQFVLAGLWGYGEAPFGIASDPYDTNQIDIVVKKVGQVTSRMHTLKKGDRMTIRGPYGNGYPLKFFSGRDVLLITGGSGIPPIASLIRYIIANRAEFGRVHFVYGAKTSKDLLLRRDIKKWEKKIGVMLTVDGPECDWKGHCGFVTDCLSKIKVDPLNTVVAMCGPGPMVGPIEHLVNLMGISDRRIFISMERRMQCGVGRCQHCVTGEKYVCTDGPVFNLDQIDRNWD